MHREALYFVSRIKDRFPQYFFNSDVIEFGANDVNGSARQLFVNCNFTGVDQLSGPNVDVVDFAHKYQHGHTVDVCISTEMLEHDPYWTQSILNMWDHLSIGGAMILTMAGRFRDPHCLTLTPEKNYYRNIVPEDIIKLFSNLVYSQLVIEENHEGAHDTYVFAIKKEYFE